MAQGYPGLAESVLGHVTNGATSTRGACARSNGKAATVRASLGGLILLLNRSV